MNIIVNADDYGLSKAVNLGILESFQNGIVTGATMMANVCAFDHGIQLYKKNDILKLGVHLTLTWGNPLCKDLKTLVSQDGQFLKQSVLFESQDKISKDEIKKEFMAQINKIQEAGVRITHLDSHHHVHSVYAVAEIVAELAKKLHVPVRPVAGCSEILKKENVKAPDYFDQSFYGENISEDYLMGLFDTYKDGTLEIMCHPAYIDQQLMYAASYNIKRALELYVLCSSRVKEAIRNKKISLVNYSNFP